MALAKAVCDTGSVGRIVRFLSLLFTFGLKRGQIIAKVVTLLITLVLGIAFWQTPVWVEASNRDYQFPLGGALIAVIIILSIASRIGGAWRDSAAADLEFGGAHYESGSFWLEIQNNGYIDSGVVKVWVARAVNSDGSESSKTSLPILLETLNHGVMARGHSTVKLGTVALIDDFHPRISVLGTGANGQQRGVDFTLSGFEWADNANRIYIDVSISHASQRLDGWYELQSLSSASPHIVVNAVRRPLTERRIREQRAKQGIPPAPPSPESTSQRRALHSGSHLRQG